MDSRVQREIQHGRYLVEHGAGEIWNWEGVAGQRRWRRRVQMLSEGIHADSKVLELGCGTGYFTNELCKTGASITAIDISPDLLAQASSKCQGSNVTFAVENAYQMSFAPGFFDHVVGSSVLHHLEVKKALKDCFRVLKPLGTMRFTEPNMLNPQIAVQKNVALIKRWLGDSVDETAFIRFLLLRELRAAGFVDIHINPFDFLHPKTPRILVRSVEKIGLAAERIPIVREIAGSLFIRARKPGASDKLDLAGGE